jgi:protein N-terminal amidase
VNSHIYHTVEFTYRSVQGTGFVTFELPPPLSRTTIAICMDLNSRTREWSIEDGPYELADYCLANNTRLLVLLNAWLYSPMDDDSDRVAWYTIDYWITRLRPLWEKKENTNLTCCEETIVVVCNRSGEEAGKPFIDTL